MPSTAIRSYSYDAATHTLFVTFVDGDLYAYFDVPPSVHQGFGQVMSKGGYFARKVRGKYAYRKVEMEG